MIEGGHLLNAALEAGVRVEAVFASPDASRSCPEILDDAREAGVPVAWLAPGVIERVTDTVTPQPVLAVAPVTARDVASSRELGELVLVLADVRDPGNAGTLLRSAEAAGASAVVFCRGTVDAYAPKVVRSSAGALFHVPVAVGGEPQAVLEVLQESGQARIGTIARGGEPYDRALLAGPLALVLGNEAWGLPDRLRASIDVWVTIPMAGRTESLNVAMAGSILLFEAARQRRAGR